MMKVENKNKRSKVEPMFIRECSFLKVLMRTLRLVEGKLSKFLISLTVLPSLGADNGVFRNFQLNHLTALIFCLLFHQGKSMKVLNLKIQNQICQINYLHAGDEETEQMLMKKIINHEIPFELYPYENQYIAEKQIYDLLKANPSLTEDNEVLQHFIEENESSNLAKINRIQQHISLGNLEDARSVLNELEENVVDINDKSYYEAFLNYANNNFSPSDSIMIYELANKCPYLDGTIVYEARSLYHSIYGIDIQFEDNCPKPEKQALQ